VELPTGSAAKERTRLNQTPVLLLSQQRLSATSRGFFDRPDRLAGKACPRPPIGSFVKGFYAAGEGFVYGRLVSRPPEIFWASQGMDEKLADFFFIQFRYRLQVAICSMTATSPFGKSGVPSANGINQTDFLVILGHGMDAFVAAQTPI